MRLAVALSLLLSLSIAGSTSAQVSAASDVIGIYFDTSASVTCGPLAPGPHTAYVYITNPSSQRGGVGGWEAKIWLTGPAIITNTTFQGNSLNFLSPPEYLVGIQIPLYGNPPPGPVLLATFDFQLLNNSEPVNWYIDAIFRHSLPDPVPAYLDGDDYNIILPLRTPSGDPAEPVATINGTCPDPGLQLLAMNDVDQSVGVDELVSIDDPSTGVGNLIGSLGDNFIETEAMAVRRLVGKPNGEAGPTTLNGPLNADQIFAVDNDRLLQLDPSTGDGTEIGPIGFPDVDGIAVHPSTFLMYGVTYGTNQLVQIDTNTGQGTLVASDVIVGRRLEDIAFHPNGDAYVLTSGPRVYRIDLATGEKLARWELSGATSLESMIWSPDGTTLYSAADRNGTKDLVTIQLSTTDETGTITFVSAESSGFMDIEALVFLGRETVDVLKAAYASPPVDSDARLPRKMQLMQNVPNPFNPNTSIHFELAEAGHVELTVFDAAGRQVTSLVSGHRDAGPHTVQWNGRTSNGQMAAAGVYQYVLKTASGVQSRRMVLVK
jgi:hypothetical protein